MPAWGREVPGWHQQANAHQTQAAIVVLPVPAVVTPVPVHAVNACACVRESVSIILGTKAAERDRSKQTQSSAKQRVTAVRVHAAGPLVSFQVPCAHTEHAPGAVPCCVDESRQSQAHEGQSPKRAAEDGKPRRTVRPATQRQSATLS